ncbi:hypothetical protein HYX11_01560 [Candidatus Woesearchaeota archaeon]|nr:hypothetical protein [Candidatus Woesearchaeota archaeon]
MGWLSKTVGQLRKLLTNLEQERSDKNFRKFYTEVELKLKLLNEEYEEVNLIQSSATQIRDKIDEIKSSFDNLLFMKNDIYNTSDKQKSAELKRFSVAVNKLSQDIEELNTRLKPLEKVILLIKDKERKIAL